MPSIVGVVPWKSNEHCKSRLASVLSPAVRMQVAREMLQHVLSVLTKDLHLSGRILLGSGDEALRIAVSSGFEFWPDHKPGLNAALHYTLQTCRKLGYEFALVIPGDLPLIKTDDLDGLFRAKASYDAIIVPSKERTGTNALLVPLEAKFVPSFGPGSFSAHLRSLTSRGISVGVYESPGLCFDLDTPEDWLSWGRQVMKTLERRATE